MHILKLQPKKGPNPRFRQDLLLHIQPSKVPKTSNFWKFSKLQFCLQIELVTLMPKITIILSFQAPSQICQRTSKLRE